MSFIWISLGLQFTFHSSCSFVERLFSYTRIQYVLFRTYQVFIYSKYDINVFVHPNHIEAYVKHKNHLKHSNNLDKLKFYSISIKEVLSEKR